MRPRAQIKCRVIAGKTGFDEHHVRGEKKLDRAKPQHQRGDLFQQTAPVEWLRAQQPERPRLPDRRADAHGQPQADAQHHASRIGAQRQHQECRHPQPPRAIENVRPAEPEKILLSLQDAPKHRQPEGKQNYEQRDP